MKYVGASQLFNGIPLDEDIIYTKLIDVVNEESKKDESRHFFIDEAERGVYIVDADDLSFIIDGPTLEISFRDLAQKFAIESNILSWLLDLAFKEGIIDEATYNYYTEMRARARAMLIPVSQRLYEKKGTLVGLGEYYFEFKKIFPETDISIAKLEELIRSPLSSCVIGGIEMIGNYKTVLIKPIELTGDLNVVLNIVSLREELRSGGISIEEVMLETNWSVEYAMRVLELAVRKEIARKVESLLEGDRYYFPALMGVESDIAL